MIRLFILGLGYGGGAVAARMRRPDVVVSGTHRSAEKASGLMASGARTIVYDGAAPSAELEGAIRQATHLLVSIPPGETGDPFLRSAGTPDAPNLRWVGYLSTVGVYGDQSGAWVDESAVPKPSSARTIRRVEAEQAWAAAAGRLGVPIAFFRLAGIYGPGRNALLNLAEGKAHRIVKPGQVFNRIHVADIAAAVEAALQGQIGGVFNLADDEPAPPQDVVAEAARLMGVEPPPEIPFDAASLSPMARSFYGENKRVSNRRMKEDLGLRLAYPTYREGLAALRRDGNWRG